MAPRFPPPVSPKGEANPSEDRERPRVIEAAICSLLPYCEVQLVPKRLAKAAMSSICTTPFWLAISTRGV
jgi:hypothetical protein